MFKDFKCIILVPIVIAYLTTFSYCAFAVTPITKPKSHARDFSEEKEAKQEAEQKDEQEGEQSNKQYEAFLDNVVMYYSFNQDAIDRSGNKNHGNAFGAQWVPQGKIGGAFEFDGSDDRIFSKSYIPPREDSGRALCLWFKTPRVSTAQQLAELRQAIAPGGIFGLKISTNNNLFFYDYEHDFDTGVNVCNNTWHHVTATYDGKNATVFIDGKFTKSEALSLSPGNNSFSLSRPYGSGKLPYFKGLIDEVAVFNRTLSENEIQHIYTKGIIPVGIHERVNQSPVKSYNDVHTINGPDEITQSIKPPSLINKEEIFIVERHGGGDTPTEYRVMFTHGSIPVGKKVLIHVPGHKSFVAEIKKHDEVKEWNDGEQIRSFGKAQPLTYVKQSSPHYLIATTVQSNAQGSMITEGTKQLPLYTLFSPQLSKDIYARMRNYVKDQIVTTRNVHETLIHKIPFQEESSFRLYTLNAEKYLIVIAFKMFYIRDLESMPQYSDLYGTPYYGHEVVGFIITKENKIEGDLISFHSLTGFEGDGTNEFKKLTPKSVLDETIYSVYDLEPDGAFELLICQWGLGRAVKIVRLLNGKLIDLATLI
ncbi:MAG: LamG domain-containing protein [bacterium]